MKHIVNFSGGLCSFWAAKRVVVQHGTAGVYLLFADVLIEDDDLYRFNEDCSRHLGLPVTRVCEGRTPWQLFRDEGLIGNARFPICSIRLKREMLDRWHRENCMEMDSVIYIGMDWTEEHRLAKLRNSKPFWRFEAPMQWAPVWDKCKMITETEALGIRAPRLYGLGFPHNNCGGACVAAGITHWVKLYRVLPPPRLSLRIVRGVIPRCSKSMIVSSSSRSHCAKTSITKNLSLRQLRLRIEAGENFPADEWGGCGCGTQYETAK